ncbi:hypothetical protein CDD83_6608 [Cordyceps sp. RAO-2017]|nr:hypothetical protein CDD83_6608 [Cordyceps sp. RAO-2017]
MGVTDVATVAWRTVDDIHSLQLSRTHSNVAEIRPMAWETLPYRPSLCLRRGCWLAMQVTGILTAARVSVEPASAPPPLAPHPVRVSSKLTGSCDVVPAILFWTRLRNCLAQYRVAFLAVAQHQSEVSKGVWSAITRKACLDLPGFWFRLTCSRIQSSMAKYIKSRPAHGSRKHPQQRASLSNRSLDLDSHNLPEPDHEDLPRRCTT